MGYRGKVAEQNRACDLRAEAWTLQEIADELGVAKSSVSLWVRDVVFVPKPRHRPTFVSPNPLHLAKLAQIEEMNQWGADRIGVLSDDAFLAAGVACACTCTMVSILMPPSAFGLPSAMFHSPSSASRIGRSRMQRSG